jgi:pimeloyl-ACP methyl ester carboxylesterase
LPIPEGSTSLSVIAEDGVPVHALELAGPPGARIVVHFHNNRETMVHGLELARALTLHGFGVVLVEYRGYGVSDGNSPSEDGLYLDAAAVLDALERRGVARERVVLWGMSLGTGVAAEMARRGRAGALVLVAPYTSIPDVVSTAVPSVLSRLLVRDTFDTLAKATEIRVPTLIVHGDADEVIPFSMGERLAGAIHGSRLVRVGGGHHGDLFASQGDGLLAEVMSLN